MEIILLERVQKLGQMGEIVRVKDGYARNYLLPKGKALRATEANKKRFENERVELEARNLERRNEAEAVGQKL
ncbi:MAG: 50S ribosomal protein L9, partial [Pseudomonadota bacterium]